VLLIDVAKVVKLGQNTRDKFSEINPFRLDCEVYNERTLKNPKKNERSKQYSANLSVKE
jgi:hypothetical protein